MKEDGRRDPDSAIVVRSASLRFPTGFRIAVHEHPWGQMVYATEGVMTVSTPAGSWVIPAHRAAWVPGRTRHEILTTGSVRMRTLYLRPDVAAQLPRLCSVLSVSPLLRELVLETLRLGMLHDDVDEERSLAQVLVAQIKATPEIPLDMAWPTDARARRVAEKAQKHLDKAMALDDLAQGSGASVRTLERLFLRETGLTFVRWRQQARLLEALRRLATGESVTSTAFCVGYRSTSAFVAMFRRALGVTPARYFSAAE